MIWSSTSGTASPRTPTACAVRHSDAQGRPVYEQVWYSVGVGFFEPGLVTVPVVSIHDRSVDAQEDTQRVAAGETDPTMQTDGWPYPVTPAKQLLGICAEQGMSIADVVWANDCAIQAAGETDPTMQTDGWPYPVTPAKQLLGICAEQGMSIADVVWANDCAIHGADAIRAHLDRVWAAMRASVHEGCVSTQRVLPGGRCAPVSTKGV